MLSKIVLWAAKQRRQTALFRWKASLRKCRVTWLVILLCIGANTDLHAEAPIVDLCKVLKTVGVTNGKATTIPLRVSGTAPLSFNHVGPSHGTLSLTPATLTYTPTGAYAGGDSVTFTATNTDGTSKAATVNFTVSSPVGAPGSPPDSLHSTESDTKKQIETEWKNPAEVLRVLSAFQLLVTDPLPARRDCKVLELLKGGNPYVDAQDLCEVARTGGGTRQGLYEAALGDPGDDGQPRLQVQSDFVVTVANANSLGLKAPGDEDRLFACTENLIDAIVNGPSRPLSRLEVSRAPGRLDAEIPAPVVLLRIDQTFKSALPDAALYQLLDAYPKPGVANQDYADALEDLRAAFEMSAQRLEKQVAARITATAP
jgi:Bacterial Ig domain